LWPGAEINSPQQIKTSKRDNVKRSALGRWKDILPTLGIPFTFLKNQHGPCPGCGGRDRFRFDDRQGDGNFYCNAMGGSGDGFTLLEHVYGWTFDRALEAVSAVLGNPGENSILLPRVITPPDRRFSSRNPDNDAARYNEWLWSNSQPIAQGCPIDLYLESRSLRLGSFPSALRWHQGLKYKVSDGTVLGVFPAMVAQIQNLTGETVGLHRTYLTQDGHKAPVPKPKRLTSRLYDGALKGAAIKLWEASEILCLAEGIETAIAMSLIFEKPSWATISSTLLGEVVIPDMVRKIIVGVDNDEAGVKATAKLVERFKGTGVEVCTALASQVVNKPGADWADAIKEICNG